MQFYVVVNCGGFCLGCGVQIARNIPTLLYYTYLLLGLTAVGQTSIIPEGHSDPELCQVQNELS
jgi:hypothetical protein